MSKLKPEYYQNKNGDLIDYLYNKFGDQADVFMVGNIYKYVGRYQQKNGVEDLDKAMTYLTRLKAKVNERKLTKEFDDYSYRR